MRGALPLVALCAAAAAVPAAADPPEQAPRPALERARDGVEEARRLIPFEIHGFSEGALGWLPDRNRLIRNHSFNLMEGRVQLQTTYRPEHPAFLPDYGTALAVKTDFVGDGVEERFRVEFRELNARFTPLHWLDVKAGRQILTWGTGDLIFLNDLFPKDWVSFFVGRDDEYLKRPSDALRVSAFSGAANADFVLIPFFTPDNPIRGERLSFYDPLLGRIAGEDSVLHFNRPPRTMDTMEYAGRIYRSVGSYELAAYGFKGFYKQALGVDDPAAGDLFYPRLTAAGASARGPVPAAGGIGTVEFSWYNSEDNRRGRDPSVEPPQLRYLAGYERDLWTDFTLGLQYYVEQMLDRAAYREALPDGAPYSRDEFRQLLTFRLTQRLFSQNATASLFVFFSPTDADFHLRPRFGWNLTDRWNVTVGADLFGGRHPYTMFGQLKDDNALYARLRYSF
ncbi:MAG: hypothetical protein PHN82_05175 [bacterium]|nr:hypothetical protein [bacterium]